MVGGAWGGMERVTGIEPVYSAWKAAALPLCYTRMTLAAEPGARRSSRGCLSIVALRAVQAAAWFMA